MVVKTQATGKRQLNKNSAYDFPAVVELIIVSTHGINS